MPTSNPFPHPHTPTVDEVDALTERASALLDELRTVLSEISETLPQHRIEAV